MDKQHIRDRILKERNALSPEFVDEKSAQVYEKLITLPQVKDAQTVLTYADFNNEIHMAEITGWLLFHGRTVGLPVVEDHAMHAVRYNGLPMKKSAFGIEEPCIEEDSILDPGEISLILCPGVAFSKDKARIGYGRGYYDRFMAQAPQAYRIGIAYDFQVLGSVPTESGDLPMNMIVTPDCIIR